MEAIARILEVLAVLLPILGGLCGLGYVLYSRRLQVVVGLEHEQQVSRIQAQLKEAVKVQGEVHAHLIETDKKVSKVEASQAPRVLSTEQQRAIIEAVREYRGQKVSLIELGDPEAEQFARQIRGMLRAAGWTLKVLHIDTFLPPTYGLICVLTDRNKPSAAARALITSLTGSRVDFLMPHDEQLAGSIRIILMAYGQKPEEITLFVGLRPTRSSGIGQPSQR